MIFVESISTKYGEFRTRRYNKRGISDITEENRDRWIKVKLSPNHWIKNKVKSSLHVTKES
jgi:hypothetical protein